MTTENYIKAQLARWAMEQAGNNNLNAMLAMAFVVRNRVKAGWQGGDWMAVIESATEVSARPAKPFMPNLRDFSVKMFLQQVDDIYSGALPDNMTEGALYFAELDKIEREWFTEKICRDAEHHPRVAQVGQVTLFR